MPDDIGFRNMELRTKKSPHHSRGSRPFALRQDALAWSGSGSAMNQNEALDDCGELHSRLGVQRRRQC